MMNITISVEAKERCVVKYSEILTQGDKLKIIRKKYGIKQDELSGNDITRNLISEIETNKASITKSTAEIVIKNLKQIASRKKIEITENIEYLLETELEQANRILEAYINELKNLFICKDGSFVKELKETEKFLIKWDIKDKKIDTYELAGDYFCAQNDYYRSVIYYEKVIAILGRLNGNEKVLTILRKLSLAYFYINKYNEVIQCCNFALNYYPNMDKSSYCVFVYNSALANKKLKNFSKALNDFIKVEKEIDDNEYSKKFYVLTQIANCFKRLKNYDKALSSYYEILNFISYNGNDAENYITTKINISGTLIEVNKLDEARENLMAALDKIRDLPNTNEYISDIYFEIGNIYKSLNLIEKAEKYYFEALGFCKENNNYFLSVDILNELLDINKNKGENLDKIKDEILLVLGKCRKLNHPLMYKLANIYTDNNNINTTKEILKFALNFS